jgi:predicted acetyltransferase
MEIEVRHPVGDELHGYVDAFTAVFLERPDVAKVVEQVKDLWEPDRLWAAFEGDAIRGTFRSWPSELTVPGGAQVSATAVTAVTVLPTHRRRGILRQMMTAEHAAARERGETVALLYASEYPIYDRFGYGPACRVAAWTIDARGTLVHGQASGTVELAPPTKESRDAIKVVYEAWRLRQPGEMRRRDYRWDFDLGMRDSAVEQKWKGFLALHRDSAGKVDGYARYRGEQKFEDRQARGVLHVDDLHALTDAAYRDLWRFLLEVDLVTTVKAEGRPPTQSLPWILTNARAAVLSEVGEGLWVKLLDLRRALEARTYERPGSIVLEVVDDEVPDGRTRVLLDAGPDGATCRPSRRSADLTVHVSALAAAYLGGSPLRDAVIAKGADEHRAGALTKADALMRTIDEPWCSTFF